MKVNLIPVKQLFYNDESYFGIYSCATDNEDIVLNSWGNFTIKGEMPRLDLGINYEAEVEEFKDKKYGITYNVQYINLIKPTSLEEEKAFLSNLISNNQLEEIYKVYPDTSIVELFEKDLFDYKLVKGIGEKTYVKLKKKILENLTMKDALVELTQFGLTYKTIRKMCIGYENPNRLINNIKKNPYILCEVKGIGFKFADQIAFNMGIAKNSPFRIEACIEYILLQKEVNGHTWYELEEVKQEATELLDLPYYQIEIPNDNHKFYINNNRIALMKNYITENSIAENLKRLLAVENNFYVGNIEQRIKEIEKEQGFEYTDEQKQAIYLAVEKNVIIIDGLAGTGKSTLLKGILGVLDNYSYMTCALSGKASQRIVESTGLTSSTIHRLLGYNPLGGFEYNENNPLPYSIIVLDEASMCNIFIIESLVSAIKAGGKFIILGDTGQLEPIGAGNFLKDCKSSKIIPNITLTKVHRQAQKSGILSTANKVRNGEQIYEKDEIGDKILGELKDLYTFTYNNKSYVHSELLDICRQYKDSVMDVQVITPLKTKGDLCTRVLNNELQEIFNSKNSKSIKRNGYTFKTGDKVIQCGNNYEKEVFNGTIGIIEEIDMVNETVVVKFNGIEEPLFYDYDELEELELAYALSVHRCQGSQIKNVIIAFDFSAFRLLTRQLVYTALTRASYSCIMICENDALTYAIDNNNMIKRKTFLNEII